MNLSGNHIGISMVLSKFYPWYGGAEKQALILSESLIEHVARVTVITPRWRNGWAPEEHIGNVPVKRTWCHGRRRRGMGRIGVWAFGLGLIFELVRSRKKYDVIHVHQAGEAAFFSVIAGKLLGKPVIVKTANSGDSGDFKQLLKRRGTRIGESFWKVITDADLFACINNLIPGELADLGVDPTRFVRIPNGVKIRRSNGDSRISTEDLEDELDGFLNMKLVTVTFIGKLYYQKGVDILILGPETWRLLLAWGPGWSTNVNYPATAEALSRWHASARLGRKRGDGEACK